MGIKPREIQTAKQAIQEIGRLEDEHCKGCKIKTDLRKEGKKPHWIQEYCMNDCKIGKKIKALGGILEYGVVNNAHFKAPDLTKEKYLELKDEKNMSDADIRERFGISRITLTRRKQVWGLTKIREYIIPRLVLKDLTKEELEDLSRDYSDREIAEMYGVSKVTIMKRRKVWGITKEDRFINLKFTQEEYNYLSKRKKMLDKEIAEVWEISASSLLHLKEGWGIKKDKRIPKPAELEAMGLTKERLIELVPDYSDKEIADMYGLYETTLTKHRKRLGVYADLRLPHKKIDPAEVKALIEQGVTRKAIAERLEIHKTTLTKLIKKWKEKNLF